MSVHERERVFGESSVSPGVTEEERDARPQKNIDKYRKIRYNVENTGEVWIKEDFATWRLKRKTYLLMKA